MSDNAGDNESSSTVVAPPKANAKPRAKPSSPKNNPKPQPPYAVVVLNDDDHTYAYVIDALCRVCHHPAEQAFKLAQQIDHTGRAIVWTGTFEVAELKRDQIRGMGPDFYAVLPVTYPLGVVLEPMPQ
jgi:ATP-dependent Clp protease adaptor protein ClpS